MTTSRRTPFQSHVAYGVAGGDGAGSEIEFENPRGLGLAQGTALYIAAVLGTGILVLPALAVDAAGPGSIIAVAALAVISVPLAGTFAALSRRHPDAGGVATFARHAFGPTAARVVGYWFFFGTPIGAPVAALMTAQYVTAIIGGSRLDTVLIAAALIIIPLLVAVLGVRFTGRVQLGLSAALVAVLVFVLFAAVPHASAANLTPVLPHGLAGIGTAVSLYIWAFAGWEAVAGIAGEFRHPRHDVPRATALALVVVAVAYLAIQSITVLTLGSDAAATQVPLLSIVDLSLGHRWGVVVAAIAAIVVAGVLNTYIAAFSKLGAAMGRDGDLPRWFGAGSESGGIARRGLALNALVMAIYFAIVAGVGQMAPIIRIQTSFAAAIYGAGVSAAVVLLPRGSLGWWMALLSCVLVFGLLALAGLNLAYPTAIALAAMIGGRVKGTSRRRGAAPFSPHGERTRTDIGGPTEQHYGHTGVLRRVTRNAGGALPGGGLRSPDDCQDREQQVLAEQERRRRNDREFAAERLRMFIIGR